MPTPRPPRREPERKPAVGRHPGLPVSEKKTEVAKAFFPSRTAKKPPRMKRPNKPTK